MGVTVKKRGDAWWIFINHKRRRKAKRVGDRKAAELAAIKIRAKLAEGDLTPLEDQQPAAPLTFQAYAETWITTHAQQACKFSTARVYENNLKGHVFPVLGAKPVGGITRPDCKTLIAACREKKLSPKSIENICRTLSSVLTQAVEDGLAPANPAFRLGRYYRQNDQPKIEIRPFTREEAAAFMTASKEHAPREAVLFLCALRTGMRLGELLGLQWGDIDFAGKFLDVRRNRVAGKTTTPKNGKARRIDMSTQLAESLRSLLTERKAEKLKRGWKVMPEWVFCTEDGSAVDGDNLRHRAFYRVLERAGLRRVRFHDLRHTFATLLIQNGESLAYIRDQLGHSSIQLTADVYGHLIPGANRQAVDRLDDSGPLAEEGACPPAAGSAG